MIHKQIFGLENVPKQLFNLTLIKYLPYIKFVNYTLKRLNIKLILKYNCLDLTLNFFL